MTKRELITFVQSLPADEMYAVRVWTRDDVQEIHEDLISRHQVYPEYFSDSEKGEILAKFQHIGLNRRNSREMTSKSLEAVIVEFSMDRDDTEIGIGLR